MRAKQSPKARRGSKEPKTRPKPKPPRDTSIPLSDRPLDAEAAQPARARVAGDNLFGLLGGREGVLDLLSARPSTDTKASALANMLMDESCYGSTPDGRPLMTFAKMYAAAGYSAKDVFELFNDRQHATALVVAAAAKPRLVSELVDAASQKLVACLDCGGTKRVAQTDEDGEFIRWAVCHVCDPNGMIVLDGNARARELYFDHFGFKSANPMVSITNTRDNRQINFTVGGDGTAPSPVSMIRALEQVPDVGERKAIETSTTILEGETV